MSQIGRREGILYTSIILVLLFLQSEMQVTQAYSVERTLIINPSADTYIDSGNPGSNYGGQDTCRVWKHITEYSESYKYALFAFDIMGLPTTNVTIETVTLKLRCAATLETTTVAICEITNFGELSVTWNNAPTFQNISIDSTLVPSGSEWYSWDLTGIVTTNQPLYLGVYAVTEGSLSFYSRDEGYFTEYWPQLRITYTRDIEEETAGFETILFLTSFTLLSIIKGRRKGIKRETLKER